MMGLAALQRPSLDASVPRIVPRDRLSAASALLSLSGNASFIVGGLAGCAGRGPGAGTVYAIDAVSFAVSFGLLGRLRPLPPRGSGIRRRNEPLGCAVCWTACGTRGGGRSSSGPTWPIWPP